jgi:hypothetical protein
LTPEQIAKAKKKQAKLLKKFLSKSKKKFAQMSKTLPNKENKPLTEIFTENATNSVILAHFGTGNQADKTAI